MERVHDYSPAGRLGGVRLPVDVVSLTLEEVKRMLASRLAGRTLEELALEYIHDRLTEIINSTALRQYVEVYTWLLASQIPVEMGNCNDHSSGTRVLDALCEGLRERP